MKTKKQKQNENKTNDQNNILLENGQIDIDKLLEELNDNEPKTKKTKTKTKTKKIKNTIEQNSIEQTIKQLIENNNKQNKIIEQLQNTIIKLQNTIEQNKNTIEQNTISIEQNTNDIEQNTNDIEQNNILFKTIFGSKDLVYNSIEQINTNLNEQIFGNTKQQLQNNYKNSIIYKIEKLQKIVFDQNNTINTLITANNRMYYYTEKLQNRIKQLQNKQNNTIEQNTNSIEQNTIENNTIQNNTIEQNSIVYNYNNSKIVYKYLTIMLFLLIFGPAINSIKYIVKLFNNSKNYIYNIVLNTIDKIKNTINEYKTKLKYRKINKYSKIIQYYNSKINELNTIQ